MEKSVTIAFNLGAIQTRHLPHTNLEIYHYTSEIGLRGCAGR